MLDLGLRTSSGMECGTVFENVAQLFVPWRKAKLSHLENNWVYKLVLTLSSQQLQVTWWHRTF